MQKKLVSTTLAAAAAMAFAVIPATSVLAAGTDNSVQCYGVNGCKGQSACKTASNGCKGQNSCKGTGMITKASTDECTSAGGTTKQS